MKRILFLFVLFLFNTSYAINWHEVSSPNGQSAKIDLDSIQEYNNYYFYNIKVRNLYKNEDVVITMQSKSRGNLAARINYYKPEEYDALDGDYSNITKNITNKLEPVEYGSIASKCYLTVNSLINSRKINIEF